MEALLKQASSLRLNVTCYCALDQKLMVGSLNYAIILTFEDGVEWVFRYPASVACQTNPDPKIAEDLLASEVATMKYVRENTSVPVPKIFAYSLTKENPVKVPFILMSKAQGVQLKTLGWDSDLRNPEAPHLSATHKSRIMTRLGEIVSKLNDLRFDKLGSVVESDGEYSVGECLAPPFTFHDREFLGNINRGPFNSDKEYYDALLDVYARHLEELPLSSNVFFSGPKPKQRDFAKWEEYTSAFHAWGLSVNDDQRNHQNLLDFHTAGHFMRKLTPDLEATSSSPRFSLHHHDLNAANIFVNPDNNFKVTCIIDWTNASTAPLFTAHATPGLPQDRDGTEPYLDRAFRSSFKIDDEHFWNRVEGAALFMRLCLLDSGEEESCFQQLLRKIWGKDNVDVRVLFKGAQTKDKELIKLASDLARESEVEKVTR